MPDALLAGEMVLALWAESSWHAIYIHGGLGSFLLAVCGLVLLPGNLISVSLPYFAFGGLRGLFNPLAFSFLVYSIAGPAPECNRQTVRNKQYQFVKIEEFVQFYSKTLYISLFL